MYVEKFTCTRAHGMGGLLANTVHCILVECLALWGERERPRLSYSVNVVAVYSACDKITVVVLEEACLIAML